MTSVQRRIKRGWMSLKIEKILKETADTVTLQFVDAEEGGRQFDYIPGQYLTFRFDDVAKKPEVRSYTMSSSPCEADYISVTVKEVEDGFISKHMVRTLKEGDVLRARGPIGKFCYDYDSDQDHLVMIAAGSGVTPFISALREFSPHLGEKGYPKKMSLLVGYRTKKDLICWDVLQKANELDGVNVQVTLSREDATTEGFGHGRVDEGKLAKLMNEDYQNATYMTCGPTQLMGLVDKHMRANNVSEDDIKSEAFD